MSVASSSSLRAFASRKQFTALASSARSASTSSYSEQTSNANPIYQPRPYSRDRSDVRTPDRPPRPSSPVHFSGKPSVTAELNVLNDMLRKTHASLRANHLYPLPHGLNLPAVPEVRWKPREEMVSIFGEVIRHGQHKRVAEALNELHRSSYLAELGGKSALADEIARFLAKYSNKEIVLERKAKEEKALDEHGRAMGSGRRKTATARVWIIPSKSALPYLDADANAVEELAQKANAAAQQGADADLPELPSAEFLVNQMPLPKYFYKLTDRQSILRPLRLTGLLGAYNVFALAEGGGSTGQAEAIALGLAKALVVARPETKDVLYAGRCRSLLCPLSLFPWLALTPRRCIDEKPKDGGEKEDQLAQSPQSRESCFMRCQTGTC
jgi:small subunit ribosomal protein S9